jgi:hypothetical protein
MSTKKTNLATPCAALTTQKRENIVSSTPKPGRARKLVTAV